MRLLFDVFIIIPHALSFPGVFAPNGVIGGGVQTTAWLYSFWHGCFALLVLVYAILANLDGTTGRVRNIPAGILVAVLLTGAAAGVLTLLATAAHDLLTPIMNGADYSMLVKKGISPAICLVSLAALVLLWRRRNTSALDLWLFVVMAAWLCDVALSAVVGSSRYDLGWYGGRSFGLVAASFLLLEASRQRTIGRRKTYYSAGTEILGAVKIGKGGDRRDVPDPASAPFGDVVEVARGRCSDRVGGCRVLDEGMQLARACASRLCRGSATGKSAVWRSWTSRKLSQQRLLGTPARRCQRIRPSALSSVRCICRRTWASGWLPVAW